MTTGLAGLADDPVALWIDLHRIGNRKVRCRAHLLGHRDAGEDITPPDGFWRMMDATAVSPRSEHAETAWGQGPADELSAATSFGLALGDVLFPTTVKKLLEIAVSMPRPVEVRIRPHDDMDGVPWELARFQLRSFENLTLNTVRRDGSGWIAMLRQVDAERTAEVDPDVVAAAVVRLGASQGVAEDVRTAAGLFEAHRHHTHVVAALDVRALDARLPADGISPTAVRAAVMYIHGHLAGTGKERTIALQGGGLSYESLERRLRTARTRIAVLNVCETADRLDGERSWIERLCASGAVEGAIGLKGRIDRFDESRHFAEPVISVLASGGSIGEAVHRVRASFPRPEMVVAATAVHHQVTLAGRRKPDPQQGARHSARGVAPLAVTMAAGADGSIVIATQATLTVDVRYAVFGEPAAASSADPAVQLAARAAGLFDVEPPTEVEVVKPAHRPGFHWLWEASLTAAVVNAVAGLAGSIGASERARAVEALDQRFAADDPAVRRMVDDRTFPMRIGVDGRIDAAPLGPDLDLIVLDLEVVRPDRGDAATEKLGSLDGLDRLDAKALAEFLSPAVGAWLQAFHDPSFKLLCDWFENSGLVAVTVLPIGRLAAVSPRRAGDAAIQRLQALAGGRGIRCELLPLTCR